MESVSRCTTQNAERPACHRGANHHTKPGYWESIRDKYGTNPRIDFLGYVAEEAVPDFFRASSIVVLPTIRLLAQAVRRIRFANTEYR
jgi:glycosyltransferase involved in cell wall biosynthesis